MTTHVRTAPSAGTGNGLFATRDFDAGEEILTISEPLIAVPDNAHLPESCSYCLAWKPPRKDSVATYYSAHSAPLLTCARCKTVKYCDQNCQRSDWKAVHKKECRVFARLQPRVLPAPVRALARLLFLQSSITADSWKTINNLKTHIAELSGTPKWEEIRIMAKGAAEYSGTTIPEPMVLRLFCLLLVNTVTLATPTLDPIGLCFDPLIAILNHSCIPNASIIFTGRGLQLRSLQAIKSGSEINIPYVDTTFPTATRREELRSRWFFTCNCPLCLQGPTAPTDALACTACGGRVPFTKTNQLFCEKCHKMQAPLPDSDDLKLLHKSKQYPLHRQPLPTLHANLIQSLLADKNYPEALKHQLLLTTRINPVLYPVPHHPIRVCSMFVLAALLMEVSRDPGAELASLGVDWGKAIWATLLEVEKQVDMSHGRESGFANFARAKKDEVAQELKGAGVGWLGDDGKVAGIMGELKKVETVIDRLLEGLRK